MWFGHGAKAWMCILIGLIVEILRVRYEYGWHAVAGWALVRGVGASVYCMVGTNIRNVRAQHPCGTRVCIARARVHAHTLALVITKTHKGIAGDTWTNRPPTFCNTFQHDNMQRHTIRRDTCAV